MAPELLQVRAQHRAPSGAAFHSDLCCDVSLHHTWRRESMLMKIAADIFCQCKEFDEAVDVYSYGVLCWEMMTGQEPWGHVNDPKEIVCCACSSHVTRHSSHVTASPGGFAAAAAAPARATSPFVPTGICLNYPALLGSSTSFIASN